MILQEAQKGGDDSHHEARNAMKSRWRQPRKSMGWYNDCKQTCAGLPSG